MFEKVAQLASLELLRLANHLHPEDQRNNRQHDDLSDVASKMLAMKNMNTTDRIKTVKSVAKSAAYYGVKKLNTAIDEGKFKIPGKK